MNLHIFKDPLGGVTFTGSADVGEINVMSVRQREDLQLGLALLNAAVRPDEAFESDGPLERVLEVVAAHEYELVVAAAEKEQPR